MQSQTQNASSDIDALELLTADHRQAKALFKKFDSIKDKASSEEKLALAKKVCGDLLIHMAIEEGIFYPALRKAINDEDMMNEAEVEHDAAKDLITQLGELKPDDPMFDAKLTVLSEQIEHHVKEEESEMFDKARKSSLDLKALGQKLSLAKADFRKEHGLPPE